MFSRRLLLTVLATAGIACSQVAVAQAQAAERVITVGTLKLIHGITPYFYEQFTPPGYSIKIVHFDTPTDGKNAVVTKSVDFGTYGLAAATLGAAAGEPVTIIAPQSNGGMAIVVNKAMGLEHFKDLKGKRIGILPGTTQEAVFLDRLKAEGMNIKDVKSVRVAFSEMSSALERGDIDAYVGAEPGPSISLSKGFGKILELPYSTPSGSINMVMTTHTQTLHHDPELVKVFLGIHQRATDFANTHRGALVAKASHALGLSPDIANMAADNVELVWAIDNAWTDRAKYYASLMLERKQIRKLPDFEQFIMKSAHPQ